MNAFDSEACRAVDYGGQQPSRVLTRMLLGMENGVCSPVLSGDQLVCDFALWSVLLSPVFVEGMSVRG